MLSHCSAAQACTQRVGDAVWISKSVPPNQECTDLGYARSLATYFGKAEAFE